jgi:hypothetical protein
VQNNTFAGIAQVHLASHSQQPGRDGKISSLRSHREEWTWFGAEDRGCWQARFLVFVT